MSNPLQNVFTSEVEGGDGVPQCLLAGNDNKTHSNTNRQLNSAPIIDVNLLIANQDYRLLACNNGLPSSLGMDRERYPVSKLQHLCGMELLVGTGDSF